MNDLMTLEKSPVQSLRETITLGEILAKSGFFADARSAAQAVVKVLAGRELGFSPIASMTGVHVIEGKPSVGAHLMASMIKRSGRYDYKVVRCDKSACKLHFLERSGDRQDRWQDLGDIELTMEEAVASGLAIGRDGKIKTNWARNTDDMLFARCISKGFRRYCPDLTGGVTVYDPDEMDRSAEPIPGPQPVDASYTVTHPDGTVVEVGMDETVIIPPVVPEGNGQAPAETPPPPATDRKLAEPEIEELANLVRDSGADVKRFLAHFNVKTIRQMTSSQYQTAVLMLRAKLAKARETAAT